MGESDPGSRPFSFDGSIDVNAFDESVSADAGALLMRELMERTGLVRWPEEQLIDDRRPDPVSHSVGSLLRTFLLLIAEGHSDQEDANGGGAIRACGLRRENRAAFGMKATWPRSRPFPASSAC